MEDMRYNMIDILVWIMWTGFVAVVAYSVGHGIGFQVGFQAGYAEGWAECVTSHCEWAVSVAKTFI